MAKPGKFPFIQNESIRLSYEYAYRSVTKANLWDVYKQEETISSLLNRPDVIALKLRNGSNWARCHQVMFEIAHKGWDAVVADLEVKGH
jgi:hypothetical protein